MNHCLMEANPDNESYTFNCEVRINFKKQPNDTEDMETDTEKHELSCLLLEKGKTEDTEIVINTTDNSAEEVSCGGNSCNKQIKAKSDEFWNQEIHVDKQGEYDDYDAREVGTYDCYIKKERTYDIKISTEENKLNCTWLEVGKCKDLDQGTVKSDDLSHKPIINDNHKVEKYENDIKEENVENMVEDIKSCSEDLSTELICKDDPESSGVHWYNCDFCEYRGKCKQTLRSHFEYKHNANAYWHNCKLCEYRTKVRSSLKQHIKYKHEIFVEWCRCKLCPYKTKSKGNLKSHLRIRHDLNVIWHRCQHCEFKTKYKQTLEAHLVHKHKIIDGKCKLWQCQFCNYTTVFSTSLKKHLERKHDPNTEWHQCRQCSFRTKNEDTLERHIMRQHETLMIPVVLETEHYKCGFCKFKADKQCVLTRHFFNVHHKIPESYKCVLCEFQTEDRIRLTLHFKKNHLYMPTDVLSTKILELSIDTVEPRLSEPRRTTSSSVNR